MTSKIFMITLSFVGLLSYSYATTEISDCEKNYKLYLVNYTKCNYEKTFVPENYRQQLTLEQFKEAYNEFVNLNGQVKPHFGFGNLPEKTNSQLTIATLNLEWSGFDNIKKVNDAQGQGRPDYLQWDKRKPAITSAINFVNPDVLCLQELSKKQIEDLQEFFVNYKVTAVSANKGLVLGENKTKTADSLNSNHNQNFLGIMAGMMVKDTIEIVENGFFYLNSQPNFYPNRINPDIAYEDDKFGNIRSERIVLWAKLKHKATNNVFITATSHFPMDMGKYRHESMALSMDHLKLISRDLPIAFGGDFNLFKDADGIPAYKLATTQFTDWRVTNNHYGHTGTFAGFSSDKFKANIDTEGAEKSIVGKGSNVDFIFYKGLKPLSSFSLMSEFDPNTGTIYPFDQPIVDPIKRVFGSDHALIGNTIQFEQK